MTEQTLEERLRFLEAHVGIQEELLVSIQAERIEADRLAESVDRLGLGASDLGAALLQVDKNQQLLMKHDHAIEGLVHNAATKGDVESARQERKREVGAVKRDADNKLASARSQALTLATAVVVMLATALIALAWWAWQDHREDQAEAYEECTRGRQTIQAVNFYLEKVRDTSANSELADAADAITKRLRVPTCER